MPHGFGRPTIHCPIIPSLPTGLSSKPQEKQQYVAAALETSCRNTASRSTLHCGFLRDGTKAKCSRPSLASSLNAASATELESLDMHTVLLFKLCGNRSQNTTGIRFCAAMATILVCEQPQSASIPMGCQRSINDAMLGAMPSLSFESKRMCPFSILKSIRLIAHPFLSA